MYPGALISAFWVRVIEDLTQGDEETRLWLDTGEEVGGFLFWSDLSDRDPDAWRGQLLKVWRLSKRPTGERSSASSSS